MVNEAKTKGMGSILGAHGVTFRVWAAEQVVYIDDDQPLFIQVAEGLGIRGIRHMDYLSTCGALASFGLQNDERVIHETS